MPVYKLTYARVVYLTTLIKAQDEDEALLRGCELELEGKLGIEEVTAKKGSTVDDIWDNEHVWEAEPTSQDEDEADF